MVENTFKFFFTLTIKQSTPKIFSTMNVLRHLIIGMRLFFYFQIILLLFSSDPVRRSNLNSSLSRSLLLLADSSEQVETMVQKHFYHFFFPPWNLYCLSTDLITYLVTTKLFFQSPWPDPPSSFNCYLILKYFLDLKGIFLT